MWDKCLLTFICRNQISARTVCKIFVRQLILQYLIPIQLILLRTFVSIVIQFLTRVSIHHLLLCAQIKSQHIVANCK
jgi:hypothetical protein